jgi:hypothetical protein
MKVQLVTNSQNASIVSFLSGDKELWRIPAHPPPPPGPRD